MKKNAANILTDLRILGSILLLFFPAFSAAFYCVYIGTGAVSKHLLSMF